MALPTRAARPLSTPTPSTTALTDFLATIISDGKLKRGLATAEQKSLEARKQHLVQHLILAPSAKVRDTVARCFLGLGYAPDREEAEMVAVQYITVLADQPLWAIEQACMRFARGEVRPDELDQKEAVDFSRRPSTAHLHKLTRRISSPFAAEAMRIEEVLRAPIRRVVTEADRASTAAKIEAWQNQKHGGVELSEKDRKARAATAAEIDRLHRERVIREYAAAGLDPPEERPNKALVSLPLLLSMGWTIVQERGANKLVAPPPAPAPAPPPDTRAAESHQRMLKGLKNVSRSAVATARKTMEAARES